MHEPGPLLASGRDADIFEYQPGLVLRRSRHGRSMAVEARVMEYARAHGYPVPAVAEVSDDGTELVMERIEGASMVDVLARRPWNVRRYGRLLADLHRRLHEIPAPDWLGDAPSGQGDRLLHLDLHPLNVMVGGGRAVVIDWSNAARGDPDVDVALTWILMAAGAVPMGRIRGALLGRARAMLIQSFLGPFDPATVREQLAGVVGWKVRDPNMSSAEQAAMWKLVGEFS